MLLRHMLLRHMLMLRRLCSEAGNMTANRELVEISYLL